MRGLGESPATPWVRLFVEISSRSSRSAKLSWSSLLHNLPEKRGPSGEPIWRTKQRQNLFSPLLSSPDWLPAYLGLSNPWPIAWNMVVLVKGLGLLALNPAIYYLTHNFQYPHLQFLFKVLSQLPPALPHDTVEVCVIPKDSWFIQMQRKQLLAKECEKVLPS